MNRSITLEKLKQLSEVSVLIIGGGVNGIATFRDLALQGVDVLLVEKGDFCSGASAASSHMAHGGLRYLENAEFRLVREALHERNRLLLNAPHYVHPLPTTIPIFSWFSGLLNAPLKFLRLSKKPSNRGALIIKVGVTLYDLYARQQRTMPTHKFASKKKSLQVRPPLNPDIQCTVTYYDGWIENPERLCIEMLLDAETANPSAYALNYVAATKAEGSSVTLKDEITGVIYTIKPKVVINAAGPWIDFVNEHMTQPTHFIGGTKGSHVVLDHPELYKATAGSEMFFENKDGRITLFFPYLDKVLAGTTDIPIANPDEAVCTEEEVDYILDSIKMVFPNIKVDHSQIVFRFTGVRPLPSNNAMLPGQVSRDHSIQHTPPNSALHFPIYSLVGGKWTTFRAFAEEATTITLGLLGKSRQLTTESLPIGGGKDYPKDKAAWIEALHQKTHLPKTRLDILFKRYGTLAETIAEYCASDEDYNLPHLPDYSRREVRYITEHESIGHLDDFLLRRSLLAILGNITRPGIDDLAEIIGHVLGWSEAEWKAEIARTVTLLTQRHKMKL